MAGTQPRAVLKRRPWRTTEVQGEGADALCVKRFHDPRPLGGLRDRIRAERERRRLVALARAGVPVPEVLGVHATPEGRELWTRWIPGAVTVDALLDAGNPPRGLARRLGRLLARLHAAGWSHGDLHAGNAVVDERGEVWLVDLRALRRASGARRRDDLVQAASEARERTSQVFRARFLRAYLRALPPRLRDQLGDARALHENVEAAARERRRIDVARSLARWLRESGVCARIADTGDLRALDVPEDEARRLAAAARGGGLPADVEAVRSSEGEIARAWLAAAELCEHRLRGPRPLVLGRGEAAFALLASPAVRAPLDARLGRARLAATLGDLAGSLYDRGIALPSAAARLDPTDRAHVAPGAVLVRTRELGPALAPWRALDPTAARRERAAFAAAFVAAQRGSRRERAALRAEIVRG